MTRKVKATPLRLNEAFASLTAARAIESQFVWSLRAASVARIATEMTVPPDGASPGRASFSAVGVAAATTPTEVSSPVLDSGRLGFSPSTTLSPG